MHTLLTDKQELLENDYTSEPTNDPQVHSRKRNEKCAVVGCDRSGCRRRDTLKIMKWKMRDEKQFVCEAHYRFDLRTYNKEAEIRTMVNAFKETPSTRETRRMLREMDQDTVRNYDMFRALVVCASKMLKDDK